MPSNTTNLGLYKKNPATDGNDFFDIDLMMNQNWDKIDQKVGAEVVNTAPVPVTLTPGLQVITAPRDTPFNVLNMRGRTLVNLLGRDGGFEVSSGTVGVGYGWYLIGTYTGSTLSFDTTNKIDGAQSQKIVKGSATTVGISKDISSQVVVGKTYIVAGCFLATVSSLSWGIGSADGTLDVITKNVVANPTFTFDYATFTASASTKKLQVYPVGNTANIDSMRVFEITSAEKALIDLGTYTAAQLAAKYPYIDDIKTVYAPYAYKYGKNLLPPFGDWVANGFTPTISSPYSVSLVTTAVNQYLSTPFFPSVGGATYTLNFTGTGMSGVKMYVNEKNVNDAGAANSNQQVFTNVTSGSVTFTLSANTVIYNVLFGSDTTAALNYTITNPRLNIGTRDEGFEPRNDDYIFLPNLSLHSNLDGSVADQLYVNGDGQPRKQAQFKDVVLDGGGAWTFNSDYTGFKFVTISLAGQISNVGTAGKYDGKILSLNTSTISASDQFQVTSSVIGISIADVDSGWGETYTPSAAEIQAYFYGWKIYDSGTYSFNDPNRKYTGSGTKTWSQIINPTTGTTITPTTLASGWTPYRLIYQLAQAVDEPVESEGNIVLHEGANQIEVGNGVIVRERAKPNGDFGSGYVYIGVNGAVLPGGASETKYRNKKINSIFRNRQLDKKWKLQQNSSSYGVDNAYVWYTDFDSTAVYEVTYLALYTYALGIMPQSISGEYSPNLRTSIDRLVRERAEVNTRLSVLERSAPNKAQPQWIAPTLLNGWTNLGGTDNADAGYMKDGMSFVRFKGIIKPGTTTVATPLFKVPVGYRPGKIVRKIVAGLSVSTAAFGYIAILPDGQVIIDSTASPTSWIDIDVSFSAEQ